jgi:predicted N-acetyltransferase YhbS
MVHELRKHDGIKELSLVAEADEQLVGHIICSNARIETPDGRRLLCLILDQSAYYRNIRSKESGKP